MVAVMDASTNLECNLFGSKMNKKKINLIENRNPNVASDDNILRTVAMSANIANTVKDEVKHLIRIAAYEPEFPGIPVDPVIDEQERRENMESAINLCSLCSHILPGSNNIFSAIVISKWDDIMGPQTIHVWMQQKCSDIETEICDSNQDYSHINQSLTITHSPDFEFVYPNGVQNLCNHSKDNWSFILKRAVRYITCHTISYSGINLTLPKNDNEEVYCNIFVVPELDFVSQTLGFHVFSGTNCVPYSVAVIVKYYNYQMFLHLRHLCHLWLQRLSSFLQLELPKFSCWEKFQETTRLNDIVLEFCHVVNSLNQCGLGKNSLACVQHILFHPLLESALTSHLQTFGCTVVMAKSAKDINNYIAFLAQFLEDDEKFCSRSVLHSVKHSFHIGLFLQGLLLDDFGFREIAFSELTENPFPVTTLDLTRTDQLGAVKQFNTKFWKSEVEWTGIHGSILQPAKTNSCLIQTLLKDIRHLPARHWQAYIKIFLRKIKLLASTLISHIQSIGNRNGRWDSSQLMLSLGLEYGDFLIILATAEVLRPGIYALVMLSTHDDR